MDAEAEIDTAADHAFELLQEHVARYRQDILIEPAVWRARCRDLAADLDAILRCRESRMPLPAALKYPPPFRR
jgi:hypothetical protein